MNSNYFQALSEELARRSAVELTNAGFPPDVTHNPVPLPGLLTRKSRRWNDDNASYRQQMRDAGRGGLLGG